MRHPWSLSGRFVTDEITVAAGLPGGGLTGVAAVQIPAEELRIAGTTSVGATALSVVRAGVAATVGCAERRRGGSGRDIAYGGCKRWCG